MQVNQFDRSISLVLEDLRSFLLIMNGFRDTNFQTRKRVWLCKIEILEWKNRRKTKISWVTTVYQVS